MRGKARSVRIYEDEDQIAILDINPISRGHTLVIPKRHYENLHEMPFNEALKLFQAVYKVSIGLTEALKPDGFRLMQNNGRVAGQVVMHVHFHIIPFYRGVKPYRRPASYTELEYVGDEIRKHLRF